jgi:multidrug efflux pump subunit AcrA (membrane-fusion protein)
MKRNLRNNWALYFIVALLSLASCGQGGDHADHADTYTCPMHPTVISDRPSTCPVCGMDLVRKARVGEEVEITEDLSKLIKSPNETVIASIKTIKGEYKSLPVSIEAQGVVTYDTRNIYSIPSRVGGRLEKVYLKYAFQTVSKGQKIAEIYSPELSTAQRELLFLLENDADNKPLIDAAKNKLELLGFTISQINNLIQRKETSSTIAIYSPYNGYLITGQQTPSTSVSMASPTSGSTGGGMSDGMGGTSSQTTSSAPSSETNSRASFLREGNYISAGEPLASVVNTDALRIELDLPASQAAAVKKGEKLKLNFGEGHQEDALVDFVQPFFSEGQDFVKLRVSVKNSKDLHIGHLVTAKIALAQSEALWVPKEAVLDLGTDKIVFVKDRGVLKPKKVGTGISSNGLIEIKSGMSSSDEIAANAQYLIDSESFIKTTK